MATAVKLTQQEIAAHLLTLSTGWNIAHSDANTDMLTKRFVFPDFVASIRFVNRLADAAEAMQHHPDIDIRYDKVTVSLSTHDAGGITELDFTLATKADAFSQEK